MVELNEPSVIEEVNNKKELFSEWLGNKRIRLKLEYRGSIHGEKYSQFHNRIDNK
jgi:hypothetical protein